jgi:hypothetical protein
MARGPVHDRDQIQKAALDGETKFVTDADTPVAGSNDY